MSPVTRPGQLQAWNIGCGGEGGLDDPSGCISTDFRGSHGNCSSCQGTGAKMKGFWKRAELERWQRLEMGLSWWRDMQLVWWARSPQVFGVLVPHLPLLPPKPTGVTSVPAAGRVQPGAGKQLSPTSRPG